MKSFTIIAMTAGLFFLFSCNASKKAKTDASNTMEEVDMRGSSLRLIGNEPYWSVDITDTAISLKQMDKDELTYPYFEPKRSTSVMIYETSTDMDGRTSNLKIIVEEKECSDGMSDRVYNYKATVIKDGRTMKGCGEKL